ncbi:MAG: TetR/AcrR family transcriptional regulator [Pseudomonadota bacterium]
MAKAGADQKARSWLKEPTQKRARRTRNKIVEAARDLFAQRGFEETTTTLIAERAGVSIGSIYAHFNDKWDIFLVILEAFQREVYSFLELGLDKIMKEKMDLGQALEWLVRGLFKAHDLNGKLNLESTKFALMDERARAIRSEWEGKEDQKVLELLEFYADRTKVDNTAAAAILLHQLNHVVFQFLFQHKGQVDEKVILDELIKMQKSYLAK